MITLFRSTNLYTLSEIKKVVTAQLKQLPNMISPMGEPQKILRYEFVCEPIDILAWLHNNHNFSQQMYWSDRDNDEEIGGVGLCDIIESKSQVNYKETFEYLEDHLSDDNPRLRYYGGFSFQKGSADKEWESFGVYRFAIPQFEIFKNIDETLFAFNIAIKDINEATINDLLVSLDKIDFSEKTTYRKIPSIQTRADSPNESEWNKIFDSLESNEKFKLEKIVLARKSTFDFDVNIRPSALLKHLKDHTPCCFHFYIQTDQNSAFLGATPERLYKKINTQIESEAIAGTAKRGKTELEDRAFETELIESKKNALEHKCVVDAIHHTFLKLCDAVKFDDTFSILKLKGWQHLITKFSGTLKAKTYNEDILPLLHPTPAVAGNPRTDSLKMIEELEPFSRGWYAGPVGYVGYDKTEFAVAIRSGVIHKNQLALYAGAGIVEGSQRTEEWDEVENKISRFMKVFDNEY